MSTLIDTPVWTYAEIAEHTGLSVNALRLRAHEGRMPAPDGRVGQSPFWMQETIRRWAPDGQVPGTPRRARSDRGVRRGPRQARPLPATLSA